MNLELLCKNAAAIKYEMQTLSTEKKNQVLEQGAQALVNCQEEILKANELDMQKAVEKGMPQGLQDRLRLTVSRIEAMAEGLLQIANLPDPVGEIIETFDRPNGLHIEKCRVPIGVIGIIYEARPNVTADAFGLCFKTGNVVILKGGSDAFYSNQKIVEVLRRVLGENGISVDALTMIEDTSRETVAAFMKMHRYVNLLIPRGGAGLIRSVVENSTIPVIETGTGNCHIYVDAEADLDMAISIIFNAKTQRIGVCNACESLVIHEKIKDALLPKLAEKLREKQVEIRGDEQVCEILPESVPATEEDYGKEYLDYILSMKTVGSIEEAIAHINRYNTGHSEAIITKDKAHAEQFLREVDAACVYVNASTRFTDGFEFGFGAEIGISTQMLHARGPMGLRELTSYKYQIYGNGQVRA
ncbi:MAG: glutamate-5-semialdehyde dehydrogenase [Lachnospiraceae bacterium]|nr:glutamate-5-semialdehyde dehydrogenase [Lachnospiraceae bacterium]